MTRSASQPLFFVFCAVFILDLAFLFGGPAFTGNPDWLYFEFELEESEDVGEEETLIQDSEFSIEIALMSSQVYTTVFSVNEPDLYERHDSRGPPVLC